MSEIRELLNELTKRLAAAPERAASLAKERGEVSDQLHRALDAMRELETKAAGEVAAERNGDGKPKYPNEASRNAETARRLAADQDYQDLRQEADRLRHRLREIDAQAELVGRRHRSDVTTANLVVALLNAGLRDEALAVLEAYAQGLAGQKEKPAGDQAEGQPQGQAQADAQGQDDAQGLAEGTFKVLEARTNDKGVVRAWVEGPQGKVALYAKNGAARTLQAAVGKRVKARYRALDKGLFAVAVEVVA